MRPPVPPPSFDNLVPSSALPAFCTLFFVCFSLGAIFMLCISLCLQVGISTCTSFFRLPSVIFVLFVRAHLHLRSPICPFPHTEFLPLITRFMIIVHLLVSSPNLTSIFARFCFQLPYSLFPLKSFCIYRFLRYCASLQAHLFQHDIVFSCLVAYYIWFPLLCSFNEHRMFNLFVHFAHLSTYF